MNNIFAGNQNFNDRNKFTGKIYYTPGSYVFTVPTRTNSAYFNGSSCISIPAVDLINDFTFEFWAYSEEKDNYHGYDIISCVDDDNNPTVGFKINKIINSNNLVASLYDAKSIITQTTETFNNNVWHHIALVRYKNVITLYVDGQHVGSTIYTGIIKTDKLNIKVSIKGYISNLRLIDGTAVYNPGNFTSPTELLPDSSGTDSYYNKTVLLLHMNGSNNSNIFIDSGSFSNTINNSQNVLIKTDQFKFSNSSAYFSGSEILKIDNSSGVSSAHFNGITSMDVDLIELSHDYTIECWIYVTNVQSNPDVIGYLTDSVNQQLIKINGGKLFYHSDGISLLGNISITNNKWYHVAVTRNNNVVKIFVNGVLNGSIIKYGSDFIKTIGRVTESALIGNVSNIRIINGTAIYQSSFVPSSIPLEIHSNTVLLTAQHPNLFVDNSNYLKSITKNLVSASNTLYPFNNTIFDFGKEDFTIDCWIYLNSTDIQSREVFSINYNNSKQTLSMGFDTSRGNSQFSFCINNEQDNSVYLTDNELSKTWYKSWNFVSLQRQAEIFTCYINGIQQQIKKIGEDTWFKSIRNTQNYVDGGNLIIGKNWSGYLQDFRVTRGVARYKENFEVPKCHLSPIFNTYLLTCQHNILEDNSGNNLKITNINTISSSESPFSKELNVDYLVVGAGGSGGQGHTDITDDMPINENLENVTMHGKNYYNIVGGGGGGGGVLQGNTDLLPGEYTVVVAPQSKLNTSGESSQFHFYIAVGGGCGGSYLAHYGLSGGSGGGAAAGYLIQEQGGAGIPNQGHDGASGIAYKTNLEKRYLGGGGGGAGESPSDVDQSIGGNGIASDITGIPVYYGGGGGGASYYTHNYDVTRGGIGGGGAGCDGTRPAENGQNHVGGGGGGGRRLSVNDFSDGGLGGCGTVILKYNSKKTDSIYDKPGVFKYIVPDGVFNVSVLCVGAGGGSNTTGGASSFGNLVSASGGNAGNGAAGGTAIIGIGGTGGTAGDWASNKSGFGGNRAPGGGGAGKSINGIKYCGGGGGGVGLYGFKTNDEYVISNSASGINGGGEGGRYEIIENVYCSGGSGGGILSASNSEYVNGILGSLLVGTAGESTIGWQYSASGGLYGGGAGSSYQTTQGAGGGTAWANNIYVTPGQEIIVTVGIPGGTGGRGAVRIISGPGRHFPDNAI